MRLIDASKVVQDIVSVRNEIPLKVPCAPYELLDYKPWDTGEAMRCGIRKALRCIEESPTIDAVPVVHAKWDTNGRCTNCGGHAPYYATPDKYYKSPYCFECGAKMDLEVR